ncbi:MAG TPA: hypothetical protein VFP39_08805 [Gemmatimonadales bacterium]|nr:hypothetical protein [Gemmatimonadales bacterium]
MKRAMLLLAVPVALAACTAESGGPNAAMGRVNLAVSGQRSVFASSTASVVLSGDSTVIAADSDTVIVKSVDLVLRRIELKPVETAACDTIGDGGERPDSVDHPDSAEHHDSAGDDGIAERDREGCEEIKAGPVLVSLPLGDTAVMALVNVAAPAGQYDALEFKIHAPRLPRDSAFLAANPGFDSISIRVTGTFSHKGTRTDFTFTSGLEAEQEVGISPPLVVDASGMANVTLRFDLSGWFAGPGGVGVVDPGNAANGGLINENIHRSINAFEDDNHDGHDDHSGEGSGGGEGDG